MHRTSSTPLADRYLEIVRMALCEAGEAWIAERMYHEAEDDEDGCPQIWFDPPITGPRAVDADPAMDKAMNLAYAAVYGQ